LLITDTVDKSALQDIPVALAMDVLIYHRLYLAIGILNHFFRTRTLPSPPQFGQRLYPVPLPYFLRRVFIVVLTLCLAIVIATYYIPVVQVASAVSGVLFAILRD